MEDKLLTVADVAEKLNVHRNYVFRIIKDKSLKAYNIRKSKIRPQYRIKEGDLTEYLDSIQL